MRPTPGSPSGHVPTSTSVSPAGWSFTNTAEELHGYHLEQAYRYRDELGSLDDHARSLGERAGELLTAAGRQALARDDVPAAVNLLERGVALLPRTGGTRGYALLELAIALMRSGVFRGRRGRARGGSRSRPCRGRPAARAAHADRARSSSGSSPTRTRPRRRSRASRRRRFRLSRRSVTTAGSRGRGTS